MNTNSVSGFSSADSFRLNWLQNNSSSDSDDDLQLQQISNRRKAIDPAKIEKMKEFFAEHPELADKFKQDGGVHKGHHGGGGGHHKKANDDDSDDSNDPLAQLFKSIANQNSIISHIA